MGESVRSGAAAPSRTRARAAAAREHILDAVIECLDRYGYARTSINRIQQQANITRGALTHHFASKEELMVVTAERLLRPTLTARRVARERSRPSGEDRPSAVEDDILWMWEKLVNTRQGRALLEILVASRTDAALKRRISDTFARWNMAINAAMVANYGSPAMSGERQEEIWTICRVFLRGLNTQSQFEPDPEARRALVRSFAAMIAPLFAAGKPGRRG